MDFSSAATAANVAEPRDGKETSALALWTWTVDAFAEQPEARMGGIIITIQNHALPPKVLFFQEVSRAALGFLLAHSWVRENWYSSEADATNWAEQPFSTVTLLSQRHFGPGNDTDASTSCIGRV